MRSTLLKAIVREWRGIGHKAELSFGLRGVWQAEHSIETAVVQGLCGLFAIVA